MNVMCVRVTIASGKESLFGKMGKISTRIGGAEQKQTCAYIYRRLFEF